MDDMEQYLTVTLYAPETGMILGTRTGQRASIECDELPYVEGAYNAAECYVDMGGLSPAIRPRPQQETQQDKTSVVADVQDALVLSRLPVPCTVRIGGHEYEVDDGELEWSTLLPGTYPVRVEAFPYLDWESEVIAVAGSASPDA